MSNSSFWLSSDVCLRFTRPRSSTTAADASGEDVILKWGLLLVPLTTFCLGTWQVQINISFFSRIKHFRGVRFFYLWLFNPVQTIGRVKICWYFTFPFSECLLVRLMQVFKRDSCFSHFQYKYFPPNEDRSLHFHISNYPVSGEVWGETYDKETDLKACWGYYIALYCQ